MKRKLFKAAGFGAALLCIGVALVSYRYVAHIGPVPPNIEQNRFLNPWIIVHAGAAATALLSGPLQLSPSMRRRPRIHRWIGRTYIGSCLAGGASALVLAVGVSSGPAAEAGFAALGILWLYVTTRGWAAARARRFPDHRRWMIRSFALTFAAVTLRIYLPFVFILDLDFTGAYRIIAWLSWVPNAILAELFLLKTNQTRTDRT